MLDLGQVRADFAAYLAAQASARHSLDAALMHVVERAYQQGLADALQVPDVLRDPIPDLDPVLAPGVRSPLAAGPAAGLPARAPGQAGRTGTGRGSAPDHDPAAPWPGGMTGKRP